MNPKKRLLITIDGPAGAGKTTVSRCLADRLGYRYIDTGALYRAVALKASAKGVGPNDDRGLEVLCASLDLQFVRDEKGTRLRCDSADITDQIRTPEITMLASTISARPIVRTYLLGLQRDMGQQKGIVVEGRDMGTVVFPDADIKFFLDASPKTRALRRFKELAPRSSQTLENVERDMKRRDQNDSTRKIAPLKAAEDAIWIDSTDLSAEKVVEQMLDNIVQLFGRRVKINY
jgi:cytidylate kinase